MGTYSSLNYHIVFGTKYRRSSLTDEIQPRLFEYMGGLFRTRKGVLLEIGGIEDHVHILAGIPAKLAVSDMLREIKAHSSSWINSTFENPFKFEWQKGYSAFTVSYSGVENVRKYIQNQKEHHRRMSFSEELVVMLDKHQIVFDHNYLFEDQHHG